ncbi:MULTISPECIES: hypothetical protein [Brucella]|uniref:Uncharacterized protein n=2 Tax=Brucella TaxID=234 RepID=A0A502BKB4_9HYPH|nr:MULTISPECIES: hypothetical protein [Brucella]KAB0565340.1 hypothetical protein F7Q93_23505 [Brucella pituitosa]TPF74545.1 hypothetical protein FHY56_13830 [Brucella gallinifaecis]
MPLDRPVETTLIGTNGASSGVCYCQMAGKAGQRMAQDIEGVVPKGPLVKLEAGSLIGVLFLESVLQPSSGLASRNEAMP